MTIKALYPAIRPTLSLDFAKSKVLDPRITFTRASTATFVGSNGLIQSAGSGAARFDHNQVTLESLGLLVEEARTNLVLRSAEFDNATWAKGNLTVTANATTAPDGTLTADKLVENTATAERNIQINVNATGSVVYTFSVFAKAAERSKFQIYLGASATPVGANFDLATGTTPNALLGASMVQYPNGWYKCSVTFTHSSSGTKGISIYPAVLFSPLTYQGDGASGLFLWGAQMEAGSFPTSYIPTTTATVTRAADVATLANTGSSIFPTSAFTTVNSPYGTAGGGSTVKLVGPTVKRTAVYNGDLTQTQINALAEVNDDFWRWRVVGSSFALPSFATNGSVTVDWGDGVIETLTTAAHTFTNGGGYHDIGFRLDSGTYFRPTINNNATYKNLVIALGPAPASLKLDAFNGFIGCSALKAFDGTVDTGGRTSFFQAWRYCSSLTSFPLIDTAAGTDFTAAWDGCSSLTSFPAINTATGTGFYLAWRNCSGLTSFPLINTGAAISFQEVWPGCSSLTSFPLINTAAGTNFVAAWANCSSLTSFPLINTAAGTSFASAWANCSSLTSFPLINTAAGTNFSNAWLSCAGLTSFPLINTGAGTNFNYAWRYSTGLTSFPLINTAAGTSFIATWGGCSGLTSFPLINTGAGIDFYLAWSYCSSLTSFPSLSFAAAISLYQAWYSCTNLSSFPANVFDTTGTLVAGAFTNAFFGCALTATSIENILTSLVTNGQSNITLGLSGGTNAGASTWTANAIAAYNTLISRGWTITRNA
jgi:hypothetical protein